MSSYSASARQKIASRIDKLTRQKALTEDQLLHLQFIFSRDESVKILADRTRRLFRLDKYTDNTLDQVVKFLDVVEKQAAAVAITTVKQQIVAPPVIVPKPVVKKTLAPARAPAPRDEILPVVVPPNDIRHLQSSVESNAILSAWLVEQTKRGKQAKKVDPELCSPMMLTTMTTDARQLPIKKKRKKTAKKRQSKVKEMLEEEEDEELEELEELPDEVQDVVLYDEGDQDVIVDEIDGEIIVDDDGENDGEEVENDENDEEVEEGEEDEDLEDVEDVEEPQETSAHSVVDSESDDDDS